MYKNILKACTVLFFSTALGVWTSFAVSDADWDELQVAYQYDEQWNDLSIEVFLEDPTGNLFEEFDAEIMVNGREATKIMTYSRPRNRLFSVFTFNNVDDHELNDYFNLDLKILNNNRELFNGNIELRTSVTRNSNSSNTSTNNNTQSSSNALFPSWIETSQIELSADYNTQTRILLFKAELPDINTENLNLSDNNLYTAEFTIDGQKVSVPLQYSQATQSLIALYSESILSSSQVRPSNKVGVKIFEGLTLVNELSKLIRPSTDFYNNVSINTGTTNTSITNTSITDTNVNKTIQEKLSNSQTSTTTTSSSTNFNSGSNTTTTNTTTNTTNNSIPVSNTSWQAETIILQYISRVESESSNVNERIRALTTVKNALQKIRSNFSNPQAIDTIINILTNRIEWYNQIISKRIKSLNQNNR